jgi:hypothetical protein
VIIKVITYKITHVVYLRLSKCQSRLLHGRAAALVTRMSSSYNSVSTISSVLHNLTIAQSEMLLPMFLGQKAHNLRVHCYVPGNNIARRVGQLPQDRQIRSNLKTVKKWLRSQTYQKILSTYKMR